ncbi:hypothetical protein I548_0368 [Mycobacterium intracellulare]|nr:hypothetical protein I548_0368 [Mycobacterium intracellulare]
MRHHQSSVALPQTPATTDKALGDAATMRMPNTVALGHGRRAVDDNARLANIRRVARVMRSRVCDAEARRPMKAVKFASQMSAMTPATRRSRRLGVPPARVPPGDLR